MHKFWGCEFREQEIPHVSHVLGLMRLLFLRSESAEKPNRFGFSTDRRRKQSYVISLILNGSLTQYPNQPWVRNVANQIFFYGSKISIRRSVILKLTKKIYWSDHCVRETRFFPSSLQCALITIEFYVPVLLVDLSWNTTKMILLYFSSELIVKYFYMCVKKDQIWFY